MDKHGLITHPSLAAAGVADPPQSQAVTEPSRGTGWVGLSRKSRGRARLSTVGGVAGVPGAGPGHGPGPVQGIACTLQLGGPMCPGWDDE
jgi:hypothetical protein